MNSTTGLGRRSASDEPLVSVIVPAWNAEATLDETLRSVASQTHRNLEIVIVDDGSTDRTLAVAEEFCASEPRARVISKENGGVASARNCGISKTRGEWIAPLDADDLWHPTKIEKQLAAAEAAPEPVGFVYCWFRRIDAGGSIIASGFRWALNGRVASQLAYLNVVGNGSSLLLSRDAATSVGGYDTSLKADGAEGCEDMLIQLRVAAHYPIACVEEHLVGWRLHGDNMSGDLVQIACSCDLAYERLIADGIDVPPQGRRWAAAICGFYAAEQLVAARKYASAIRQLKAAFALDPVRCGYLGAYRLVRSALRRLRRTAVRTSRARFYDVDPATDLRTDPHELAWWTGLLDSLDRRRLARLARVEARQG